MAVPIVVVDLLRELDAPYDIVIADAGLLGRHGASRLFAANRRLQPHVREAAADDEAVARWRGILAGADKVWAMDRRAQAFASRLFPGRKAPEALPPVEAPTRAAIPRISGDVRRLGLLPIRTTASEHSLMREIATAFCKDRPAIRLVVVGTTLNDSALMRCPNVHVTGPVDGAELETLATTYALDRLFACVTQPLFGHPLLDAAFEGSRPLAYVDWTGGAVAPRRCDLPLDPSLPLEALLGRLQDWLETRALTAAKRNSVRH